MTNKHFLLFAMMLASLYPADAYPMSSANYNITSDSINIGGVREISENYVTEDTIGEEAAGASRSGNYKIGAGYQHMWEYPPGLTFTVDDNTAALGMLSTTAVSTDTTTFSVSTNASDGYAVTITGNTLTSNSSAANIDAISGSAPSAPGTEQFGINLVDNSNPNVGANPSGGTGHAATGYDTANNFKYVSGNTIASCNTYSVDTTYTISYMANINSSTVAGDYNTNLTLVATAQY